MPSMSQEAPATAPPGLAEKLAQVPMPEPEDEIASADSAPPGLLGQAVGEDSVGSANHGKGECRPCAWYWKSDGCKNGAECLHCHRCPSDEIKRRRKAKI